MTEIESSELWILTKIGNIFGTKNSRRVIVLTETKINTAAKVTAVNTGILQAHRTLLEMHRSTGNCNKRRVF
jgi:hypothetical protein